MTYESKWFSLSVWHDYEIGNWTEFYLVHASAELEHVTGTGTIQVAVCGVHLAFQWVYNRLARALFMASIKEN